MASTNKTSLGLNMWEASDKPVRQDFVNDNTIIDSSIAKLNSDLVGSTYENFTAFPADWLPSAERGFSHQTVVIGSVGNFDYAPPTKEGGGSAWWNVLTFGISTRCTQIACFSYGAATGGGMIYMRHQHDTGVSGWMQVL